jgi:flagellar motor switch protein FliN/FliY
MADESNVATADPMAALSNVDADLAAAQASIDELLKQASFEDPSSLSAPEPPKPVASWSPPTQSVSQASAPTRPFDLPGLTAGTGGPLTAGLDLLTDVELNVKIELGRSRMMVEDVLKLGEGSVVELDKLAGDPVDVYVNDKLVARGEVLVLNDNFCVRVNEIVAGVREEAL